MIQNRIRQLWQENEKSTVREAIVDTLILSLNMRRIFTEDQLLAAIAFLMDICDVQDDDAVLTLLRDGVERVNDLSRDDAVMNIGLRLDSLDKKARESVMLMAIIYFHFSAPDDDRSLMKDSILPYISATLHVTDSIPHLLNSLRDELNTRPHYPESVVC